MAAWFVFQQHSCVRPIMSCHPAPPTPPAAGGRVWGRQPRGHRQDPAPHLLHPQPRGQGGGADVPRGPRHCRWGTGRGVAGSQTWAARDLKALDAKHPPHLCASGQARRPGGPWLSVSHAQPASLTTPPRCAACRQCRHGRRPGSQRQEHPDAGCVAGQPGHLHPALHRARLCQLPAQQPSTQQAAHRGAQARPSAARRAATLQAARVWARRRPSARSAACWRMSASAAWSSSTHPTKSVRPGGAGRGLRARGVKGDVLQMPNRQSARHGPDS